LDRAQELFRQALGIFEELPAPGYVALIEGDSVRF
jgi:hypothetical protein